jgi:hypothetical protein
VSAWSRSWCGKDSLASRGDMVVDDIHVAGASTRTLWWNGEQGLFQEKMVRKKILPRAQQNKEVH